MKKYIKFELIEENSKAKVYLVLTNKDSDYLGKIKWYSSWRQYVFYPAEKTMWSTDCLDCVCDFINKIMKIKKVTPDVSKAEKAAEK